MRIDVSRIPDEGLRERAVYDPATLDMGRIDIRLVEPFAVEALIMRTEGELIVTADIRCPLRLSCARCLEEFSSVVTADAVLSYRVKPTDVIDITEDIRQEIMLAYPMIPVCQPECKGLCRVCGQNLNALACPHAAGET